MLGIDFMDIFFVFAATLVPASIGFIFTGKLARYFAWTIFVTAIGLLFVFLLSQGHYPHVGRLLCIIHSALIYCA